MSNYQKPQAVKDLERQALDHFRRDHPNFPEYAIPPQPYRDNTANGLTKCIVDYIRYNGGQAERINTTVKIGLDRQSEAQRRYQATVERAGGLYFIAKDFTTFVEWYSENFNRDCYGKP